MIGDVGITIETLDDGSRVGTCGWFLEKRYWGRGLATEAARLLVEFGFEELELDRLRASCDAKNVASERIMQRCEMRFRGEVARESRPGKRRHYELDRPDRHS